MTFLLIVLAIIIAIFIFALGCLVGFDIGKKDSKGLFTND